MFILGQGGTLLLVLGLGDNSRLLVLIERPPVIRPRGQMMSAAFKSLNAALLFKASSAPSLRS